MNSSYIYALLDPRKKGSFKYEGINTVFPYEPFYIGKGKYIYRAYSHLSESKEKTKNFYKFNKIAKIRREIKKDPIIFKIYENLSTLEALEKEKIVIKIIGRGRNGPLTNLTDGGEGMDGYKHSKKAIKLIIKSNKARPVSELTKKRISEGVKRTGWHPTEEMKKAQGKRVSGTKCTFFGKRLYGKNNHMYGKNLSEAQKKILSDNAKKRLGSKNPNNKYVYCFYNVSTKECFHNVSDLRSILGVALYPVSKKVKIRRFKKWVVAKIPKELVQVCACKDLLIKDISEIPIQRTKRIFSFLK
jgi:hypothetical protein